MSSVHAQQSTVAPSAGELRGSSPWSSATLVGLLLLCATLPYANTLSNGFVQDDNRQVLANPYIRSFRHLPEIFGSTVWSFQGAQGVTNYYRPMMTLGYLLCYQLYGQLAYGFHLANIVLHAAVVCVLFWLTEKLFRDRALSVLASGVFALHPIHTESVAWIAAVTDVELTFFYLLTFWLFLRVARPGGRRSNRVEFAMVGAFIMTILSKEQALTLPLLATVYEHLYREDREETTSFQKIGRYGALWLVALTYLVFRVRLLGALAPVLRRSDLTYFQAFLSGIALVGQYLGKLLWPLRLSAFYMFHGSMSPFDPGVLAGAAALILISILFLVLWKRERLASFGILWMFITLAPVLNPRWMAVNVFAERYAYLPSVGFCWLVGAATARLWARVGRRAPRWRRVYVGVSSVLASLALVCIVTRNRVWKSDLVLLTQTLAATPEATPIRNNLAAVYWDRGDTKSAERVWREALKENPNDPIALNNLGLVALKEKRYTVAVEFFQRALRVKSKYVDPHLNLSSTYLEMGLSDEAALQLRAAVLLSPLNARAHNDWGRYLAGVGRLREAEEQFRQSVESTPNVTGYDALGEIYLRWGQWEAADRAFRDAVSLDEFDSRAHFNLGALRARTGRNSEAIKEYQAGLVTDPANPEALVAVQKLRSKVSDAKP